MSKKLEIQQKAKYYSGRLFPNILHTIDSVYDFNREVKISNTKDVFKNIRLDILFENYSNEQRKYLFDLLDKVYSFFMKKKWYEFNYLTNRILADKNEIPIPEKISFMKSKEFLSITEQMVEDKRELISDEYLSLKEDMVDSLLVDLVSKVETETETEETNEIYDLLDTIRNKDHTELQLYNIVKERTQLNKDALQYLYKDIEVYLFSEKDDFECRYSEEETKQAIEDLKAKGYSEDDLIMLGYIRKSKAFNVATNDMDLDFTYINKEKIFFPLEFFPIYQLQGLINEELSKIKEKEELQNPHTKSSPKLKADLSVPQLSLVFKMINDLKPKIFNTKSDAELFRFISANFQTKKSSEKGISTQKLRNEFNNPNIKAIEFWEKHLHTMLSELRKLK